MVVFSSSALGSNLQLYVCEFLSFYLGSSPCVILPSELSVWNRATHPLAFQLENPERYGTLVFAIIL